MNGGQTAHQVAKDGKLCELSEGRSMKRARREEWAATFDAIHTPLLVLAPGGAILRANRAARDLSGLSDAEILGRTPAEVGRGEPWNEAAALVARLVQGAGAEAAEVRDEESGRSWQIEATLLPASELSEARIILQLRDVTETVRLHESVRRAEVMATLGAVVVGLAHEVRNPLFGMSSVLDAFASRFGDRPEYQHHLSRLRAELERLKTLMQSLLAHGRPARPNLERGSLRQTVEEALLLCRPEARRRKVTLEADFADSCPVACDREQLVLALKNVVDNGVQHAPAGGSVRVVGRRVEIDGAPWIRLTVEDSGPGFPEEELARVFEPFYSRRAGGTGLGLAIVAQTIEGHGGLVRAHNWEGGGAIEVLLPALDYPEG
jgi:PAS domain S-box-containing protein